MVSPPYGFGYWLPIIQLSSGWLYWLVSNLARHPQFDLGPEFTSAQNAKPSTDTVGPLAHSLEAPVSILSPLQVLRIDSTPVVAHREAQVGGTIFDLSFNVLRPGMTVRIDNRLTDNTVNVVTGAYTQFPLRAKYNHSKTDRRGEAQIVRNTGKCVAEGRLALVGRAQPLHDISSLFEYSVQQLHHSAKSRPCSAVLRQAAQGGAKLHGHL